jgi:hypothetical protein
VAALPTSACTVSPQPLHLERLWIRNVTITTGLVDTFATPTLIRLLERGQLQTNSLVTHHVALDDIMTAYDTFEGAAETGALKVVLEAPQSSLSVSWGSRLEPPHSWPGSCDAVACQTDMAKSPGVALRSLTSSIWRGVEQAV